MCYLSFVFLSKASSLGEGDRIAVVGVAVEGVTAEAVTEQTESAEISAAVRMRAMRFKNLLFFFIFVPFFIIEIK